MVRRFNPAPGWPAAPEGWLPPAGWRPDPSWPAAPPGWPIVVEDGVPSGTYGQVAVPGRPTTGAAERAWYRKKRYVLPVATVLAIGFLGSLGDDDEPTTSAAPGAAATREPGPDPEQEASADAAAQAEAEAAAAKAEADAVAAAEAQAAAAAEAAAAAAASYGAQPADQVAFLQAVQKAQHGVADAGNDLQVAALKAERDAAICALLPTRTVAGWTGKVTGIDANGEGKGIVSVDVAEDVEIGTWNNFLSDAGDETLIEASSPVFQSVLTLTEGQVVRFSGTFAEGSGDGCIREASLTLSGGLETPGFKFRFSEIGPA